MVEQERIPVNVITGFLGSGKTTLLQKILKSPRFANAAVLINEFGEVGIDHLIVAELDDDAVVLENGCICCTSRDDLKAALLNLLKHRTKDGVPPFDRVIVETTGLADPAPIITTLMRDMMLRHHFRAGNIIATVDGVFGASGLREHSQIHRQIAIADTILVTKKDMVDETALPPLVDLLRTVNGGARIEVIAHGDADIEQLLETPGDVRETEEDVDRWVRAGAGGRFRADAAGDVEAHGLPVSVLLTYDEPVEWVAFGLWLSLLVNHHGKQILRLKGVVQVEGSETPVVIQGVQQFLHPAAHLSSVPRELRPTTLVLLGYGLDKQRLEHSLATFMRWSRNDS
jgi:G3E family GTPase